jgi:mitochondrial chaperone BCS1
MPRWLNNITDTQLPRDILEAFIPGYSIIRGFFKDIFGFDITLVVSICFILVALTSSVRFLWKHVSKAFKQHLMASIR